MDQAIGGVLHEELRGRLLIHLRLGAEEVVEHVGSLDELDRHLLLGLGQCDARQPFALGLGLPAEVWSKIASSGTRESMHPTTTACGC